MCSKTWSSGKQTQLEDLSIVDKLKGNTANPQIG